MYNLQYTYNYEEHSVALQRVYCIRSESGCPCVRARTSSWSSYMQSTESERCDLLKVMCRY